LRHPGRIVLVILRAPGKGADANDMVEVKRLPALAILALVAPDYREAIAHMAVFVESLAETGVA
jgi:hypothetical protein